MAFALAVVIIVRLSMLRTRRLPQHLGFNITRRAVRSEELGRPSIIRG